MGVLKRKVDSKAKGFTPYSGPEPKPGIYRARVVKGAVREASTGTLSYNVLVEFKATKDAHKQYDGFDTFCEIWLGEKEASQAKEAAFIKAITGKDNFQTVNVAYTGKEADFKTQSGAEITGLDGVKLPNKIVNVHMRMEKASTGNDGKEYPARLRADSILPWKESDDDDDTDEDDIDQVDDADVDEDEDDEADTEDDGDEDEDAGEEMSDEEWEAAKEARRKELKSREYDLAKLRAVLKENGVDTKGLKKDELVEAVLGLEFPEDGEEDEDQDIDENDVEVDEDAAESDESEEDEDEDEEEDDEEEDDEEEDDLRTEIEAEAAGLDRAGLKKAIKALDDAAGFKKSESDDDLRERFVELKLNAPGF